MQLATLYGVDTLRYFLLRDISFGQDGTFSDDAIVTRANSDLANSFGNLAQRTLSFIAKNLGGELPAMGRGDPADAALVSAVGEAIDGLRRGFMDLHLSQGLEAWMRGVFACNQYIDVQAPWALRKTDPDRMHAVLGTLVRVIRDLAVVIYPVVPASAEALLAQLGQAGAGHDVLGDDGWYAAAQAGGFRIAPPTPIFPRLTIEESVPV